MANDSISSLEFDDVAERFLASDIGQKLREYYATIPDEADEDEECDYCSFG